MVSPWSPMGAQTEPSQSTAAGGGLGTNVRSPRRGGGGLWWIAAAIAAIVALAIVVTAVVTYALTHQNDGVSTEPTVPQKEEPQFSAAEEAAAKDLVCQVFDVATRGKEGQGGVRVNGELNVPLVLRKVNSVVAVQNALTPAVPAEVTEAARKFMTTSLELTTAAMGNASIDELTRLTTVGNTATYALADVCGLPH
jgi:hypothetical protein